MIRLLFNFAKEPLLLFLQILLDRSLFHDLLSQKSDRLLRAAVDAPVAHGTPLILHCLPADRVSHRARIRCSDLH